MLYSSAHGATRVYGSGPVPCIMEAEIILRLRIDAISMMMMTTALQLNQEKRQSSLLLWIIVPSHKANLIQKIKHFLKWFLLYYGIIV